MSKIRDTQRKKVYKAGWDTRKGMEFEDLSACQVYVDKVVNSRWWTRRYPHCRNVIVSPKRGGTAYGMPPQTWARPVTGEILLPPWAMNERVIIHELSHCAAPMTIAWHGREYCAIFLEMITRWMGKEAGTELRNGFKKYKAKYRRTKGRGF